MKKYLPFLFSVCLLLGGCSVHFDTSTKNVAQTQSNETDSEAFTSTQIKDSAISSSSKTEATAAVNSATEATAAVNSPTEEELRQLIDKNTYCNLSIFEGSLPLENQDYVYDENDMVQKVDTSVFGSYAEFEEYVRSVYCKKCADMLLYDYPYEGDPKYLNIDGDLYLNTLYCGGKGYYVDWTNCTITINYTDETECLFTVKASVEYPGENPVPEDYIVESKAVMENGKWLLSEMIY